MPGAANGFGTRTIGIDFGVRRTGLAVSAGIAPLPLGVIAADNMMHVAKQVVRAARSEGASQFVLGMPYNSSGGEGEQAIITRAFGTILAQEAAPMPVYLWDERFTSAEASMRMNQGLGASMGQSVDAVAAAIILEEFFDGDYASAEQIVVEPGQEVARVPRPPATPAGPPPSYLEARRQMMERVALKEAARAARDASLKPRRRKKSR
jgi:putative Holliday junction resolvase